MHVKHGLALFRIESLCPVDQETGCLIAIVNECARAVLERDIDFFFRRIRHEADPEFWMLDRVREFEFRFHRVGSRIVVTDLAFEIAPDRRVIGLARF